MLLLPKRVNFTDHSFVFRLLVYLEGREYRLLFKKYGRGVSGKKGKCNLWGVLWFNS